MRVGSAVRLLLLAVLAPAMALLASAHAQTLLLTLDSPNPQARADFGFSVAVGDVNGDGKGDVAVGAVFEDVGPISDAGRVYVISGVNGSPLFTLDTPSPWVNGNFGSSVAVGDVNGDGKGDITVAAPNEASYQGHVYVFSGADGSLLHTLNTPNPQSGGAVFGSSVAVGDVNGDGKKDIAVGSSSEFVGGIPSGRAYVFSGADGSVLLTLDTPNPQAYAYFGSSVAVGDVNGDGKADIAVGVISETVGGIQLGRAYVFSGADGSVLLTLDTPNPQLYAYFSSSVAVGDVNGDGKGDIAIGAPCEDVGGSISQGRVYVFSGADGSVLLTLDTPNPQLSPEFGYSVAVGDVNGDGKGEVAVGAHFEKVNGNISQGRAYVFSGSTGSPLFILDIPNPQLQALFGDSVAVGDVNGDGKGEIAVGAPCEDVGGNDHQGRAYVFSAPVPTPTPTSPPGVGGTVNLPPAAIAAESGVQAEGSGWPGDAYAALGGMVVVIAVGGWYARRRWLR